MNIIKTVNGRRIKTGLVGYLQVWRQYGTLDEAEAEAEKLGPMPEHASN